MKILLPFASTLAICSACIASEVVAQTPPTKPTGKAATPARAVDKEAVRRRVEDWLRGCLANWEKDTHMTRAEWRATCERVAKERGKALMDDRAQRKSN